MKEKIIEILSQVLEIPTAEIGQDFSKEKAENWDSIAHLTIIAELEESFNISFEPEEMEQINSLKDIYNIIAQKKL